MCACLVSHAKRGEHKWLRIGNGTLTLPMSEGSNSPIVTKIFLGGQLSIGRSPVSRN